jgi:hypothetical protein
VREQAEARKRQKEALEAQAASRDRLFYGLTITIAVVVFVAGTGAMIWGANEIANG